MIHLNKETIESCTSMKDFIDGIDSAYEVYEKEDYMMPTRTQIDNNGNTLLLMPCFLEKYIVTKLVTVFPHNSEKNIPTIHGSVVLNCNQTGETLATLDGTYLTGARTGAIGGSAIRHLADKDAKRLAVIGAGTQGFYQALAACEERAIEEIFVYNRSSGKKLTHFIKELKKHLPHQVMIRLCDSASEAIQSADIVITATTATDPVLPNEMSLLRNKLFVGIGSFQPGMREFPEVLYKEISHLFIDTHDALKESGDIIDPLNSKWIDSKIIQPISSIIGKSVEKPDVNKQSILFKSTGSALFDAVVSAKIYEAYLADNT